MVVGCRCSGVLVTGYGASGLLNDGISEVNKELREQWLARSEHHSWYAHQIRDGWIAKAQIELRQNLSTIKLLVAICPMLGLLGTVTGMITVLT